jgi:hypothetical protein
MDGATGIFVDGIGAAGVLTQLPTVYGAVFARRGPWLIGATVGDATISTLQDWRQARCPGSAVAAQP